MSLFLFLLPFSLFFDLEITSNSTRRTQKTDISLIFLVDYILFIQADVDVAPNPNEVQDSKYVTPEELKTMFEDPALKFTPWFKLICNTMLFEWWSHFGTETFNKYLQEADIRRM